MRRRCDVPPGWWRATPTGPWTDRRNFLQYAQQLKGTVKLTDLREENRTRNRTISIKEDYTPCEDYGIYAVWPCSPPLCRALSLSKPRQPATSEKLVLIPWYCCPLSETAMGRAAELLSDVLASSSGTPTAAGLGTAQRMAPRAMS